MEQPSDSSIFNAILILNEYKNNPNNREEDEKMIRNRVADWRRQFSLAQNLDEGDYRHLMSWKPSRREFEIADEPSWPCSNRITRVGAPEEVIQAQMLLSRVKLQIENVL
jgi:hypothetical protein